MNIRTAIENAISEAQGGLTAYLDAAPLATLTPRDAWCVVVAVDKASCYANGSCDDLAADIRREFMEASISPKEYDELFKLIDELDQLTLKLRTHFLSSSRRLRDMRR